MILSSLYFSFDLTHQKKAFKGVPNENILCIKVMAHLAVKRSFINVYFNGTRNESDVQCKYCNKNCGFILNQYILISFKFLWIWNKENLHSRVFSVVNVKCVNDVKYSHCDNWVTFALRWI